MDPFMQLFRDEVMCMSYLYSKLPETGVPHHIGTGGRFGRRMPAERLSGPGVKGLRDCGKVSRTVFAQIRPFGEILP